MSPRSRPMTVSSFARVRTSLVSLGDQCSSRKVPAAPGGGGGGAASASSARRGEAVDAERGAGGGGVRGEVPGSVAGGEDWARVWPLSSSPTSKSSVTGSGSGSSISGPRAGGGGGGTKAAGG